MEHAKQQVEHALNDETIDTMIHEVIENPSVRGEFGEILLQLASRGETSDEVAGFAKAMRGRMREVNALQHTIDVCGTGGDGAGTFNISTATALVVAGAGIRVTKHGNRAATSRSGSADVLEVMGVDLGMTPDPSARINFLFAPEYHPAMKVIGPLRKRLGVATVFNILGPILNPANVRYQMVGTSSRRTAELIAQAASQLGYNKLGVVHNIHGIDELSTKGDNYLIEVSGTEISHQTLRPSDYDLTPADAAMLRGGSPEENANIIQSILAGEPGGRRDTVVLNAAYALYLRGAAADLERGIEMAQVSIDSHAAQEELNSLIVRSIHDEKS